MKIGTTAHMTKGALVAWMGIRLLVYSATFTMLRRANAPPVVAGAVMAIGLSLLESGAGYLMSWAGIIVVKDPEGEK